MSLHHLDQSELIYEVQSFQRSSPENLVCADCKTPDPRWASYNLGCFLCLRCSGIHRSLGTHISKVKSIDLDTWTVDQVQSMLDRGNKVCNQYWEAKLPEDFLPPQSNLEAWIQSKYVQKKYLVSDGINRSSASSSDNGSPKNSQNSKSKGGYSNDLNNIKFESNNSSSNSNNNSNQQFIKLNKKDKFDANLLKGSQYFNIDSSDDES